MTALTLRLPEPPSANRWWRNVNGRMVTSKAAREYKDRVAIMCAVKLLHPIAAPTNVHLTVGWFRSRKAGDLDKRLGVLLDSLQGSLYENDAQITKILATRYDVTDERRGTVIVTVEAA